MVEKPLFRIKDWELTFESAESRRVRHTRWVPIPNRQDGKSYRRLAQHPDAVPTFAAWCLMLEVASKLPERGVLKDEDGPLDADDLAFMTGYPAEIFETAFRVLSEPRIGWLESEQTSSEPDSPATPSNAQQDLSLDTDVAGDATTGREGKGRVEEGREEGEPDPPFDTPTFLTALLAFEKHRKAMRKKITPQSRKLIYADLIAWGEERATAALIFSTKQGYQGVFEEREAKQINTGSSGTSVEAELEARRKRRERQ